MVYFPLLDIEITQSDVITGMILVAIYIILKRAKEHTRTLKSKLLIAEDDVERAGKF